jgi:hypothetical protein
MYSTLGSTGGLISRFNVGSASTTGDTYDSTKPYLGTVTVVSNPDSGKPNPFVGKMLVLASAPAGINSPYLGHIVEGNAGSAGSDADPILGQVVVVASAPAGVPDPFLGTIDKE